MKYLIVTLTLILTGCSNDKSLLLSEIRDLKDSVSLLDSNLASCQSDLSYYKAAGSSCSLNNSSQDTSESNKPEYETVEYFEVDGTKCYSSSRDEDGNVPACGITFWECKDGVVRRCMTNVKYKVKEEQKLVE